MAFKSSLVLHILEAIVALLSTNEMANFHAGTFDLPWTLVNHTITVVLGGQSGKFPNPTYPLPLFPPNLPLQTHTTL